jgi:zinc and cadmium transporter
MNEIQWLATYCGLVLVASLAGAFVPFMGRLTHRRLQFYLSLSAGVMLGASFFHVMPEAIHLCQTKTGNNFGWWMSLGVVGLFAIERFIAPHSHEIDTERHVHSYEHEHHGHVHTHEDHKVAAPTMAGWMAVLGLTLHTFMNGVGLAGSVHAAFGHGDKARSTIELAALPGLALFLAIVLHKPFDALAITTVLSRKGVSRQKLALVQLGFALMVPIGAVAFLFTEGQIEESMHDLLTGAALAFSAGTFLFIALSDLLPEVQFHRHDRVPLFIALVLGVVLMGGIGYLEELGGHSHGHGGHGHDHHGHQHHDHDH